MIKLSKTQIILLHKNLIQSFSGSLGIRDENLLDSAVETPLQTFGGENLYPTLIEN